jgi:hypothetical protein
MLGIDPLAALALLLGLAGLVGFAVGVGALRRRRWLGAAGAWTFGALLVVSGLLAASLGLATQGYRALTREEVAAVVVVEPTGHSRFRARFRFPDGAESGFELSGDELYVDAHILKWKPVANLLGLHTAYELDRVSGRYSDLEDERRLPRTVHSLAPERPVDIFGARRRFPLLAHLVDAEYGSATFAVADRPARFEVRVSTTGLLIRPLGDTQS